ncbi:MAG: acyl esterase [Hyphomicrobium sp.]|nr:acyl esterase [Hyphomicrobium sp.]
MTHTPASPSIMSPPRVARSTSDVPSPSEPRYTIATLVTNPAQYDAMCASFQAGGFDEASCEYIHIDNTETEQTDAYRGLNALLNAARASIVILCHQDVRLLQDGRASLDDRLNALTHRDPTWALAGNAGGVAPGRLALRLTDPHGRDQHTGNLPERVMSLDENFIVVRRDARIGFSNDLSGFHFYGADICLHAQHMGYSAYVIDFHLEHLSPGKKDQSFTAAEQAFARKWSRTLQPRWMQTTCSLIHLSGDPVRQSLGRVIDRPLARLARRLPSARGWKTIQKAPA